MTLFTRLVIALDMMGSSTTDLFDLACRSGFPPSTFYRGADLVGVDLQNQDLRGLNFRSADLSEANLDNAIIDAGALNGAKVPKKYEYMKDFYDLSLDEVIIFAEGLKYWTISAAFRPETLENYLSTVSINYDNFAKKSGIHTATLRNARRGTPVQITTALSICRLLKEQLEALRPPPQSRMNMFELPFARLGYSHNGVFRQSDKEALLLYVSVPPLDESTLV